MFHLSPRRVYFRDPKFLGCTSDAQGTRARVSIIFSLGKLHYPPGAAAHLAHFDRSLNAMRVKRTSPRAHRRYPVPKRQLYDSSSAAEKLGKSWSEKFIYRPFIYRRRTHGGMVARTSIHSVMELAQRRYFQSEKISFQQKKVEKGHLKNLWYWVHISYS